MPVGLPARFLVTVMSGEERLGTVEFEVWGKPGALSDWLMQRLEKSQLNGLHLTLFIAQASGKRATMTTGVASPGGVAVEAVTAGTLAVETAADAAGIVHILIDGDAAAANNLTPIAHVIKDEASVVQALSLLPLNPDGTPKKALMILETTFVQKTDCECLRHVLCDCGMPEEQ